YRKKYPEDSLGIMFSAEFSSITGHDEDATKAYSEYITRNPEDALGYVKRSLTAFRHSDWDAAIKDLREGKQQAAKHTDDRSRSLMEQTRLLLAGALEQQASQQN